MKGERKKWGLLVINRMERFYTKLYGQEFDALLNPLLEDGWQLKATMESVKPIASTVQWNSIKKPNAMARYLGGTIGHSVSHYRALCKKGVWESLCNRWNPCWEAIFEELPETKEGEDDRHLEDGLWSHDKNPFKDSYSKFQTALNCTLKHASAQTEPEQIQFFEAYAKALRKGSLTAEGYGVAPSPRTSAYQILALFGPILRLQMNSVHDVHRFLEKVMGKQRAGTVKRTEEICRYLGLRFRSRGRPKLRKP